MRSIVLVAAMLTTLTCFHPNVAKADKGEAAKPESVSVLDTANLQVPATFKRVPPASRILAHEFQATDGDETARVTMMQAGGDVPSNIRRWKGQFTGGDEDAQKTKEMKLGDWSVHIVDVSGNYAERMGGGPFAPGKIVNRENYAMTGAILVHPDGRKYFVKMIGPAKVVTANREAFVKMIKSIQQ